MIEKFDEQNGFCMADCMDKINEVISAVNNQQIQLNNYECRLLDLHRRITVLDDPTYHEEPEPAENILTKSLRMDKEFAEDECVRLQNELERTRKALEKAKNGLQELKDIIACPPDISYETGVSMYVDGVLQEITVLEQKD